MSGRRPHKTDGRGSRRSRFRQAAALPDALHPGPPRILHCRALRRIRLRPEGVLRSRPAEAGRSSGARRLFCASSGSSFGTGWGPSSRSGSAMSSSRPALPDRSGANPRSAEARPLLPWSRSWAQRRARTVFTISDVRSTAGFAIVVNPSAASLIKWEKQCAEEVFRIRALYIMVLAFGALSMLGAAGQRLLRLHRCRRFVDANSARTYH